ASIDVKTDNGVSNTTFGNATLDKDYVGVNQKLYFDAGETRKTVFVEIKDSAVVDNKIIGDYVNLMISSASSGTIVTDVAAGFIHDNNQAIWSVEVNGDAYKNSNYMSYTVYRFGDTNGQATIHIQTSGTATAKVDYTAVSQNLTFEDGEVSKTVLVDILPSATIGNTAENITMTLSGQSKGVIADKSAIGFLYNIETHESVTLDIKLAWIRNAVGTTEFGGVSNQTSGEISIYLKSSGVRLVTEVQADGTWKITVPQKYHQGEEVDVTLTTTEGYQVTKITHLGWVSSPLILDLDNNSVNSIGIEEGVQFNYDGTVMKTGWVDKHDGILALDINKDGIINDSSELFGDSTKLQDGQKATDGFAALAQYDDNKDGKIDVNDAIFKDLKVWKDSNSDAITNDGELLSLDKVGVASLNLNHTLSDNAENGNLHSLVGSYTTTNGEIKEMTDV
ncbi:MAG: hypothetical protein HY307_04810, partial [Arcobacter sp.]|nr:hypothetical protein [Arcobacter sp.]